MSFVSIDGNLLKKMIIAGANNLNRNKQTVDELNVFPVPDGDTGTNMSLTIMSAAKEVENIDTNDLFAVATAASNGSLRGARGNSGVILSQLIRGFAKGLEGHETADAYTLAKAFKKGALTAYKAVMKPKEGTMLTVAKSIAEKAIRLADETDDLEILLKQSIDYGNQILNKTPEMLPVLKQAGVVDSGGKGLIYILAGAFESIYINEIIVLDEIEQAKKSDFSALSNIDKETITFGYCTEFFINVKNPEEKVINKLKKFLTEMGDSIVVVHDDEIIKVHVHSDHPGLILEKALSIGELSNLKIDNMRQQHTSKIDFDFKNNDKQIKKSDSNKPQFTKKTGFISITTGNGIADIFKNLGVDIVIEGGQTMNPSTEDILEAINNLDCKNIVILPNNKNIILSAQQASNLIENKHITVLPTKTIPQGISAMISYEYNKPMKENIEVMKKAITQVKTGQLTFAVRDTSINDIKINQGDILGIIEDNIEVVSDSLDDAAKQLISKIVDDKSEIISLYCGKDIALKEAQQLASYIAQTYPDCDIEVYNGEQPVYYYIISVE